MTNREIYDAFRDAGMTAAGACGLMGNMMAESGMKANIAQRGMTTLTDDQYTAAADNGSIDFVHDSVGYGYIQLTYWSRKQKYLDLCRKLGKSVGDAETQIRYIIMELMQDYRMVYMLLRSSQDLYECTRTVCIQYERPAVNNVDARYEFAQRFFDEFCGSGAMAAEHAAQSPATGGVTAPATSRSDAGVKAAVMVLQMVMSYAGYWGAVTGERSPEFFDALRTFTADLEKAQ